MPKEGRENFKSRLGFLLVSAGCAIGIGNVWRFPFITGQSGGAVFVLLYLMFLVLLGVPALTMELAVGRASRKSAVKAYRTLQPAGSHWDIHGWFCLAGNYLLMMYYTTVAGWMLSYFFKFLSGTFSRMPSDGSSGVFNKMLSNPSEMGGWMVVIVITGFFVVSMGLQKGLERISKFMMSALLLLIVVLAVNSMLLPGGEKGLAFYLLPDFARAAEIGWSTVISNAMNQAFFTLSLGIGAMEIFGSYMSEDHTLTSESIRICALDTFVALASGLIIFPACFSYGIDAGEGPGLIFVTLPEVFANMAGGRLWGTLFFVFMTFASFTTVIAVFENLLSSCIDNFGWDRKKAVIVNCILVLIISVPCVLGFNIWSNVKLGGMDILGMEDFLVSSLLLPAGALVYLLFCSIKWGWGFDKYLAEANNGQGIQLSAKLKPYFLYVMPVMILFILVTGLLPLFGIA